MALHVLNDFSCGEAAYSYIDQNAFQHVTLNIPFH